MNGIRKQILIMALGLLITTTVNATNFAQSFQFEGQLLDGSGNAIPGPVSLTLEITNPSGTCVLYKETHSGVPVDAVNGNFAVMVGTGTRGVDGGGAWNDIFNNSSAVDGCYTPAAGHGRSLHVTVGSTTLSPAFEIAPVPMASVAEKAQQADEAKAVAGNVKVTNGSSLLLMDSSDLNSVQLEAPATISTSYSLMLPAADGTSGDMLVTDGAGTLSWATPGGGGGTVTNVSASAPLAVANGTSTPSISLNTSGVTAGTYGSSSLIPSITVDSFGRVTAATSYSAPTGVNSVTPTAPIGASIASGVLSVSIGQSGVSNDGYLSSTDWNYFSAKLNDSLAVGKIFVGSVGGVATPVTLSGDATLSSAGALSIAPGAIISSKIASGNVSYDKIQPVTNNRLLGRSNLLGNGAVEEITIGSGLSLSSGVLSSSVSSLAGNTAGSYTLLGTSASGGGTGHTAVGVQAGWGYSGQYSTMIGHNSGASGGTGQYNTFIGANAQDTGVAGSNNTVVGAVARVAAGAANGIAIGKAAISGGGGVAIGSGANAPAQSVVIGTHNGTFFNERLRIDNLGNVGIGTTTPSKTLHVQGDAHVQGSLSLTPISTPPGPTAGMFFVDGGDSNKLKWYDGVGWQTAGGGAGTGDFMADGSVQMTGALQFTSDNSQICDPSLAGSQRYDNTNNRMEFCDGTMWKHLNSSRRIVCNYNTTAAAPIPVGDYVYNWAGADCTPALPDGTCIGYLSKGISCTASDWAALAPGEAYDVFDGTPITAGAFGGFGLYNSVNNCTNFNVRVIYECGN